MQSLSVGAAGFMEEHQRDFFGQLASCSLQMAMEALQQLEEGAARPHAQAGLLAALHALQHVIEEHKHRHNQQWSQLSAQQVASCVFPAHQSSSNDKQLVDELLQHRPKVQAFEAGLSKLLEQLGGDEQQQQEGEPQQQQEGEPQQQQEGEPQQPREGEPQQQREGEPQWQWEGEPQRQQGTSDQPTATKLQAQVQVWQDMLQTAWELLRHLGLLAGGIVVQRIASKQSDLQGYMAAVQRLGRDPVRAMLQPQVVQHVHTKELLPTFVPGGDQARCLRCNIRIPQWHISIHCCTEGAALSAKGLLELQGANCQATAQPPEQQQQQQPSAQPPEQQQQQTQQPSAQPPEHLSALARARPVAKEQHLSQFVDSNASHFRSQLRSYVDTSFSVHCGSDELRAHWPAEASLHWKGIVLQWLHAWTDSEHALAMIRNNMLEMSKST
jgi:hypothetical protein